MNPTDQNFVNFVLQNTNDYKEQELIDFCEGKKENARLSKWYGWFASYKYHFITQDITKKGAQTTKSIEAPKEPEKPKDVFDKIKDAIHRMESDQPKES